MCVSVLNLNVSFHTCNNNSIVLTGTKDGPFEVFIVLNIVVLNMLLNFLQNVRAFVHHLCVFTILLRGKCDMMTRTIPICWPKEERISIRFGKRNDV